MTTRRLTPWLAAAGAAMTVLSACAGGPATLDVAQLAAAGQGTLQVVGTQAALAETQTTTAQWPTSTPTLTASPANTVTPVPSSTPTPTDKPTVTPTELPSGTIKAAGALRAGPGRVYPIIAELKAGTSAMPLGQTAAGDWFLVIAVDKQGWVANVNFQLAAGSSSLPIITNIPPTPTRPPATVTPPVTSTPPETATNVPSAYSCNVNVQTSSYKGYVIFIGTGWPPAVDVDLTVTMAYGAILKYPAYAHTGDVQSKNPYAFWKTELDRTKVVGPAAFTFSTAGCSTTVNWP